jgi:HD-GYP domain-containing protein (c-di-GMP phosphodiesterase class II)
MKCLSRKQCAGCISNAGLILTMLREKSSGAFAHSVATGTLAKEIAIGIGLCDDEVNRMYLAALLHDAGKIFVEDSILLSHEKLTPRQFSLIKQHPERGASIVRNFMSDELALPILYHHELPDGKGYPCGLLNDEIPLSAKIISVADKFSALTMDRPYRSALVKDTVLLILDNHVKTFFNGKSRCVRNSLTSLDIEDIHISAVQMSNDIDSFLPTLRGCL